MKITITQENKKKKVITTNFNEGDIVAHVANSLNTDSDYYGIVLDIMISSKYGIIKYLISFPGITGEYVEDELCHVQIEDEQKVGFYPKTDEQK